MARYNSEGIILKSINYRDSDKIYTIYSKRQGKYIATAKGVRKVSSRRGGNLDTLNYVVIGLSESNSSGYKYINEVDCKHSFRGLKNSLDKSSKAYYIVELVDRFVEEGQENPKLFDLLQKTLRLLNSGKTEPEPIVNFFEISLMKLLGYELTFDKCVVCNRKFSKDWESCSINFGFGGYVCDHCGGKGLSISMPEASFLYALSKGRLNKDGNGFSRPDELMKVYIKSILDDDFRTTRVFGT